MDRNSSFFRSIQHENPFNPLTSNVFKQICELDCELLTEPKREKP